MEMFGFPAKFIFWVRSCITTATFSIKINGTLCGYFKGARGLRQGDPLSPYLFTIGMEVLSLLILNSSSSAPFQFHWKTRLMNLTHLLFADDLLLFCRGDWNSVKTLKHTLDLFTGLSGLCFNRGKSACYLTNVDPPKAERITSILGFQRGSLPARFLGVPLLSSKLSLRDCQPLLERLHHRITTWTNVHLSYAGRAQLIKSVLYAIQGYWASHFILPSCVLKSIQSLLTRFLWKGSSLHLHGAKVSWLKLSLPFEEGGLHIKDLQDWNKSLLLLQLLKIINPMASSLWATWIKTYQLKSKPFWLIPVPQHCSWTWRKLLGLRPLARAHIQYVIGNGEATNLWTDPWIQHRPLVSSLHSPLILNSGIPASAKVSHIIADSSWTLPPSNHHTVMDFRLRFDYSRPCNSDMEDQILWGSERLETVKASFIWECIRRKSPPVPWSKLVWCKGIPPRYSFFLWTAFHNALRTKDKLASYGFQTDQACVLCHTASESFSHLFFHCPISFRLLVPVLRRFGWRGFSRDWNAITNFILNPHRTSPRKSTLCLGLATVCYSIWQERNARLHDKGPKPLRVLIFNVFQTISCCTPPRSHIRV